jgi:hypothetical protein
VERCSCERPDDYLPPNASAFNIHNEESTMRDDVFEVGNYAQPTMP